MRLIEWKDPMSLVTKRIEDNVLYLKLNGRIDSSNAEQADEQIKAILEEYPDLPVTLDAEKLEYLSSAGLRVILRLRKNGAVPKIINVNSELYEILDMTGFTDMFPVEKAFRRLSVEGCEVIAKGANGTIYRYDDETIVKIYHNGAPLEEVKLEKELCRKGSQAGAEEREAGKGCEGRRDAEETRETEKGSHQANAKVSGMLSPVEEKS